MQPGRPFPGSRSIPRAQFTYANFRQRVNALLIDLGLLSIPSGLLVLLLDDLAHFPLFLLFWLYFALTESAPGGASPGKRHQRIRVIRTDEKRLSFFRASGRFFARALSALFLGLGFISMLRHPLRQAFHDRLVHTLVVQE